MFTLDPSQPCSILAGLATSNHDQPSIPPLCPMQCQCPACCTIDTFLQPAYTFVPPPLSKGLPTALPLRFSAQITAQNQVLAWLTDHVIDGKQRVLRGADLSNRSLKPSGAKKLINKLAVQYSTSKPVMELVKAVLRHAETSLSLPSCLHARCAGKIAMA